MSEPCWASSRPRGAAAAVDAGRAAAVAVAAAVTSVT